MLEPRTLRQIGLGRYPLTKIPAPHLVVAQPRDQFLGASVSCSHNFDIQRSGTLRGFGLGLPLR